MRTIATSLLLYVLFMSSALAAPFARTCFPDRGISLPAPGASEPYLQKGFVDLQNSTQTSTNQYSYAVYRKACPGGGAAVLIQFKAVGIADGIFPRIQVEQGSASEEATYTLEADTYWAIVDTTSQNVHAGEVVVLNSYGIDYTKAMALLIGSSAAPVPDFDPSKYPDASRALSIAGYVAGAYYDPAHSGEGVLIEVMPQQLLIITMYTFDANGNPLWLTGAASLCTACIGHPATTSTVTMQATKGGGFAGTSDASKVKKTVWGTIDFSFPNCSTVTMKLNPANTDPTLPSSTATLNWTRLTSVEYAECAAYP